MGTGEASGLSTRLLDLFDILQASLQEERLSFVSDEIDEILGQPIGPRRRLLALCEVVRERSPATPILGTPPGIKSTGPHRSSRSIWPRSTMLSRA